ncbi:uncharacterized protein LOC142341004 isoform X2 [Convolutriloba macropyga]|uniref:uncharacterized protein LOC142341004 isoform X2 n=1 Tax=Convolutriloba macropyga TaxID=536237 RepID=UPI003F520206
MASNFSHSPDLSFHSNSENINFRFSLEQTPSNGTNFAHQSPDPLYPNFYSDSSTSASNSYSPKAEVSSENRLQSVSHEPRQQDEDEMNSEGNENDYEEEDSCVDRF